MTKKSMRIGLASLAQPKSIPDGVKKISRVLSSCKKRKVQIVCFAETYLPGLRGGKWKFPPPNQPLMIDTLEELRRLCRVNKVAAIVGLEWVTKLGLENRAFVISASGRLLGHQTKNQITPGGESENYVPDGQRKVFKINGTIFGIVICHEGWRYPETVRWAATRGAKIIFHPQQTWCGDARKHRRLTEWGLGKGDQGIHEKAMQCRSFENTVYFASVNLAHPYQNPASSLIDPQGNLIKYTPYGKEQLLVANIDLTKATRRYAKRYNPAWYPE